MKEKIEYTDELTGTLADAGDKEELGIPYSPLQQMWQVEPWAEAVDPSKLAAEKRGSN